jgi:ribosome recycling factor
MIDPIYKEADAAMIKAREAIVRDFGTLRTGRANTALVEDILVEAYGATQPVKSLGNISTPDASTIMITPWDKSVMGAIEKALQTADLGMNPSNDGQNIRLSIPALTQDRRKEIVKEAHKFAEAGRVSIRNARHHANDQIKKLEKDKEISEDDRDRALKRVQDLTDKHVKEIDDALAEKEKEIMSV